MSAGVTYALPESEVPGTSGIPRGEQGDLPLDRGPVQFRVKVHPRLG